MDCRRRVNDAAEHMQSARRKFSPLAKNFKKSTFRAKEKVLAHFGKVDRTTDDIFEDYVLNVNRQQQIANKYSKELKNYMNCVRNLALASKSLNAAAREAYEEDWQGSGDVNDIMCKMELLWNDYLDAMNRDLIPPLQAYLEQFPEAQARINKRNRKLLDYDGARHELQGLQAPGKKIDEVKMHKAREFLHKSKLSYDEINGELHRSLPRLNDSRVVFYSRIMNDLSEIEHRFYSDGTSCHGEMKQQLDELKDKALAGDYQGTWRVLSNKTGSTLSNRGTAAAMTGSLPAHNLHRRNSYKPDSLDGSIPESPNQYSEESEPEIKTGLSASFSGSASHIDPEDHSIEFRGIRKIGDDEPVPSVAQSPRPVPEKKNGQVNGYVKQSAKETTTLTRNELEAKNGALETYPEASENEGDSDVNESKGQLNIAQTPTNAESSLGGVQEILEKYKVMYKVKATHSYSSEDVDELSFVAGDIIYVVEHSHPEDQDEGWQLGVKETDATIGVFPENFTQVLIGR